MIADSWIHARIAEIDERLERLSEGRTLLEQVRTDYERLLAFTDSPGQVATPTGPQGSPAPALRPIEAAASIDDSVECPECHRSVKPRGLGIHRAKVHAGALLPVGAEVTAEAPRAQPLGADVDRRNIDELCPRGCGRRFRWEPSLLSHIAGCKGTAESAAGGGSSMTSPAESAAIGAHGA